MINQKDATTYETYWGDRAFKASGLTHEDMLRFSLVKYAEALDRCGLHFGQSSGGARITVQTRAWALREACK